jgi:nitrate/nitrite transport system permease protein
MGGGRSMRLDVHRRLTEGLRTTVVVGLSVGAFLLVWSAAASSITTSLGKVPGPGQVVSAAHGLWQEHVAERHKRADFLRVQAEQAAQASAEGAAPARRRRYTGKPTYVDQIGTSLCTVFVGFLLASAIGVPLGILCGMNRTLLTALNPLIQVFRPVSPVAWLPIVTMIVSALYTTSSGGMEKSFIISAVTVALCSLWPSLLNTAIGVASLPQDYVNVARTLQLSLRTRIARIVLPASMPYVFAGLRISLGVGWMVLIASEMLAQNPGLGKFIWDEFQNGGSQSLARIMVAVVTIGVVGAVLDRLMQALHQIVSFPGGPR